MTLAKKAILAFSGITLLANIAFGVAKEKQGFYKIRGTEKAYCVMTDGNRDGILDRVDEYENNEKTKTLFRDNDGEIVEFNWSDNECSYFVENARHNEEINKKWHYYEKIVWSDRV